MLSRSEVKTFGGVNLYETSCESKNCVKAWSSWNPEESEVEKRDSFPVSSVNAPEMSDWPIEMVPVRSPFTTCFTNWE